MTQILVRKLALFNGFGHDWLHEGMSCFVTEHSHFSTAREQAGDAPIERTPPIFAENDAPRGNTHGFQAQLPAPSTFCWRQLFLRASNCSPKLAK